MVVSCALIGGMRIEQLTTGVIACVLTAGGTASAGTPVCPPAETAKLVASDGVPNDWFGEVVALDGDTAVVGVRRHSFNGLASGGAYVYVRGGSGWTEQALLVPSDGAHQDLFGNAVAISGDTIVVGSVFDDDFGQDSGAAYVFTRTGGVWTQQAKLLPADGMPNDAFGDSVAIDGDTVIIGAPFDDETSLRSGVAYAFTRTGGVWTLQSKLIAAEIVSNDALGTAVAIHGDTALIAADFSDENGANSGSAFVFTRNGSVWTEQAKIAPADGNSSDRFGKSIDIDGLFAIVGVPFDDDFGGNSGSAYIFAHTGSGWVQQTKLLPDDAAPGDEFGFSVAISGTTALVGSFYDDDNGNRSGSAYIFKNNGGIWTQTAKLLPADGAVDDEFGVGVALDVNTAIIGAFFDDDNGDSSGSAYIFKVGCDECTADINGDGLLDLSDVTTFVESFLSGCP